MSKTYKNIVYTKRLSREDYEACLYEIINILKANKIREVEMLFGFAWGNDYKNWTPFIVATDDILIEIDKAEKSGAGDFFNDDTFFTLPNLGCEILFCHEYDIHLEFDQSNVVVNAITVAWNSKDMIHRVQER